MLKIIKRMQRQKYTSWTRQETLTTVVLLAREITVILFLCTGNFLASGFPSHWFYLSYNIPLSPFGIRILFKWTRKTCLLSLYFHSSSKPFVCYKYKSDQLQTKEKTRILNRHKLFSFTYNRLNLIGYCLSFPMEYLDTLNENFCLEE